MFCKTRVLRKFAKSRAKHLCQSLFFNKFASLRPKVCNFIKKETLAQVLSCDFYAISKNTFSYRTPPVAASVNRSNTFLKSTLTGNLDLTLYISFIFILPQMSFEQLSKGLSGDILPNISQFFCDLWWESSNRKCPWSWAHF